MDRGGWQATVHGVTKDWTQLEEDSVTFGKVKHQPQQKLSSSVPDCLFSTCVFATQVASSKMELQAEPTILGDT